VHHSINMLNNFHSSMFDDNNERSGKKFVGLLKNLQAAILLQLLMATFRHVNQDYFQILLIICPFFRCTYFLQPWLHIDAFPLYLSFRGLLSHIYIYIHDGFNIHVIQISCWWKLSCQILIHLGFWDWFYIIFKSVFDLRKY
jgi:hypothetical protein